MISKKDISKLDGLLYLYAVSKAGSKREVAEKLGTSVDTINKYISDLEAEMKTYFLMSNGRGTVITPEGKQILKISETIVKNLRSLEEYAEAAETSRGIVRVCTTDAISDFIGDARLFDFFSKYPGMRIEMTISDRIPDMQALEADIFLGYEIPAYPDLVLMSVKDIRCGLFATEKYIENYGRPRDMADLIKNHRICDKSNHELFVPDWKEVADNAYVIYKTNSVHSLQAAIKSGIGVGILPVVLARKDPQLVHLKHLKFDFDFKIYLCAHKDTKDMPRIRIAMDHLLELLSKKKGI